jgi:hypothetical protein
MSPYDATKSFGSEPSREDFCAALVDLHGDAHGIARLASRLCYPDVESEP